MTPNTPASPVRKPLPAWALLLIGAVVISLVVSGIYMISRPAKHLNAHAGHLPPSIEQPVWMTTANPGTKESYAFAATNFEILRYIPCYCGCDGEHKDNFECYYQHDGNGNITGYQDHAYGCQICVEITREVIKQVDKGKSLPEIRKIIDEKYKAQELVPTATPLPPNT